MKLAKTWMTIAVFCLLAMIPYCAEPMEHFRLVEWPRGAATPDGWKPVRLDRVIITPRPTMAANLRPSPGSITPANTPLPPSLLTGEYVGKNWPVHSELNQILQELPESVVLENYGCGMQHFYDALARTEQ